VKVGTQFRPRSTKVEKKLPIVLTLIDICGGYEQNKNKKSLV